MRTSILISALVLLLAANFLMMYVTPLGLTRLDGFNDDKDASGNVVSPFADKLNYTDASGNVVSPFADKVNYTDASGNPTLQGTSEGFSNTLLAESGGAGESYEPLGAFDGIRLKTGNSSSWRYTAPNEPLQGPDFNVGPDQLFMFKNNQCKPECCGASFSCNGGCVCTTPQQRDYINQRGGNRTLPDDSV
jgi:hypothetical protein